MTDLSLNIPRLSYEIASGAQASYTFDVADNPSEGGVSGLIAMRPVLRNYIISVGLSQSREMINIIMATRGTRYPIAMRDYADNYQVTNETIPHTGEVALLGRTWAPATGSLSIFERILIPDTQEMSFVVKVNGSTASYTFSDFGKVNISGLTDSDVVTVTGQYMVPVRFLDSPSTNIITSTQHQFSDIRMKQIFENELIKIAP